MLVNVADDSGTGGRPIGREAFAPDGSRRSLDQQHRAGLGFLFGLDDLRRLTGPDTVDRAGPPLGLGVVAEGLRGLTACAVGVV